MYICVIFLENIDQLVGAKTTMKKQMMEGETGMDRNKLRFRRE
jgi:hypothetical protein